MKQLFFLHSAGPQIKPSDGSNGLVHELKRALPDTRIIHPIMPSPDAPSYQAWSTKLRQEFQQVHGEIALVGHSLGGSVLLKFLSEEKIPNRISGIFLVSAPFWGSKNWNMEEFVLKKEFAKYLPPVEVIQIYHSEDDPHVPLDHAKMYQKALPGSELNVIAGNDHAFQEGLPELVKDLKG